MRLAKTLGAASALITAGLLGGTLMGTTLAVDDADGEARGGAAAYCDTFLDTFASELGTTRDGLVAAGKAAANAAIDAAVEAGDLTEQRATAMREHVEEFDGTGCELIGRGGFGGGRGGHGPAGHLGRFIGGETLDTAAETLGLEASELPGALREAGSLEALATAQGASYDEVRTTIIVAVQADLDAAVAAGDIEQERADRILERATTWLENGGELRGRPERGDDANDS